jgi:ComF family protein
MAVAAAPRAGSVRWPWRFWTRQVAWAVVDLVFPPQCAGCDRPGQRWCTDCRAHCVALTPPWCESCGYPVAQAGRCERCRAGQNVVTALAGIRSGGFHVGPLRQAVHRLKYRHDGILADALAPLMVAAGPDEAPAGSLVVPVPLAPARLAARGYNQAALLARAYAELRGLRLATDGVRRVRYTDSQVGLSIRQRHLNVAGAFAAERSVVAGESIILIDDVCTTGATLDACAAALLAAGAAPVWGLTLVRAHLPDGREAERRSAAGAVPGQAGAEL